MVRRSVVTFESDKKSEKLCARLIWGIWDVEPSHSYAEIVSVAVCRMHSFVCVHATLDNIATLSEKIAATHHGFDLHEQLTICLGSARNRNSFHMNTTKFGFLLHFGVVVGLAVKHHPDGCIRMGPTA